MEQTEKSQNKAGDHQATATQQSNQDDYLHLWQYFSDRADMLKDRLWTMATWLFGLNSALLGFIFGVPLIAFDSTGSTVRVPAFVLALALAGCVLCLFALSLINDHGKHIRRNWNRADSLAKELPLVMEALNSKAKRDEQPTGLPPIAKHLMIFTLIYLVAFLAIVVFILQRLL